ncbi:MAG: RNA 2',3'-cyclic phosphodiesterase [Methanomicrobiales archaeon]|nr:RNA 2',3'-cyclic phosphodiesterase [Methanomicrobiales archaeon]
MVRIFIAIDLPSPIRERVRDCQQILTRTDAKLTLVNADSAHITLKFIGEIDPSLLDSFIAALDTIRFPAFDFEVSGVGANNLRSPRVIWGNVQDKGACAALHEQVERVLAPLGVLRENRAFTPHVTIARVKRPHPSLIPALKSLAGEYLGKGEARDIHLKKSTLLPSGPHYEDLYEVSGT